MAMTLSVFLWIHIGISLLLVFGVRESENESHRACSSLSLGHNVGAEGQGWLPVIAEVVFLFGIN